ncbi:hypothetical protein DCAR_0101348 [Daucus carota subsp. sativus]|uniref:Alginate lyase 2 domain-containing protein n=1 Tax=Daucus carota subsp. sativus TaxID=79200 RepID=A0AAF1AJ70_DAUCS|nr:PREDICTED: citrate-binding protein-like [Daucus carota subsp. sativus]WOG82186.1 hypothetical protein DCAR_0101348 [Daucus carota subsp. sativus]
MASFLALLCFGLSQFLMFQFMAASDPTKGFVSLPFNTSVYRIQRPYDKKENQRYSFKNGVHKFWVFANDKPHTTTSHTKPRTELAVQGYVYSSGVWEFAADAYVPKGTSGVTIMQVFGATAPHASTLMLRVYNGALKYYQDNVLVGNVYNRWFHVNVVHDVDAAKVMVYIDGQLKLTADGRGGDSHYFKCGVYAQTSDSFRMESRWKNIQVLRHN